MSPNPNSFDHLTVGEPFGYLRGRASTTGFDYFTNNEPAQLLDQLPAADPVVLTLPDGPAGRLVVSRRGALPTRRTGLIRRSRVGTLA